MSDSLDPYTRNCIRASFRKVDDDVLEIRRSARDVWLRFVSWLMLGCVLTVEIFSTGGLQDVSQRYVETLHNAINPDRIIRPEYEYREKLRNEDVKKGELSFISEKTYEEFKKGYLENSSFYSDAAALILVTLLWLVGISFPRRPPLRIDRRRQLVYTHVWGKDYLIHSDDPKTLFISEGVERWTYDYPVHWQSWQFPALIMTHYFTVDRYEQRPPKPPLLRRKHRRFDVGIFPPKDGEKQRQVLLQFIDDFVNSRDTPYLAEIDKRYKVHRPLQWILNLTCWPWSGRLNEAKTEAGIKQQLTLWQKEQRILSGEEESE